jgi:hypothetical protein
MFRRHEQARTGGLSEPCQTKLISLKRASMRPLIALLTVAAFAAAPLVYAQQATPSPNPSAATTPAKKHQKKSEPANAATTTGSPAAPATAAASPAPKKTAKAVPTPLATQAPGGGNGQVWVNTETHVYHKEGSKWYGRTKKGKYESEQDAISSGRFRHRIQAGLVIPIRPVLFLLCLAGKSHDPNRS